MTMILAVLLLAIVVLALVVGWRSRVAGVDPWLLLLRWWGRVRATAEVMRSKWW